MILNSKLLVKFTILLALYCVTEELYSEQDIILMQRLKKKKKEREEL